TIIALGMTVLMGGIIAYNGDLIGRKFGKKRLSVFGLRPKHTAILITSVTGVLISASTTAAIFLLVPPVRRVILEGEQAIRDLPKLKRRTESLSSEKLQLEGDVKAEREEEHVTRGHLEKARNELQAATESVRKVSAQLQ